MRAAARGDRVRLAGRSRLWTVEQLHADGPRAILVSGSGDDFQVLAADLVDLRSQKSEVGSPGS